MYYTQGQVYIDVYNYEEDRGIEYYYASTQNYIKFIQYSLTDCYEQTIEATNK